MAIVTKADLDSARADAEAEMIDACEIRSRGGTSVFDEETGLYTSDPGALLYSGRCKRQSQGAVEERAEAGAHSYAEARYSLHLPWNAPRIPGGSIATMTDCPYDPTAVGQRLRVGGPGGKTWATAHRLNVTEVVE